ncbi:GntR family transcriptional regulator [Maricaulis sp. D1M11]|uniref:GntR family transcriptional regulator n=1 Tax=Maricaulis sp. D1M11 TaxID=3076117 RepID=UPI0039B591C1
MRAFSDPVQKTTIVDTLAQKLRDRILHNEIEAGTQLRQEALAEAFGVSRMPVREALRQLESEGLVIFHPHRGAVVSAMSVDEATELFDLRQLVEPHLFHHACLNATPEQIVQASKALAVVNEAYTNGERDSWGIANWTYHKALYAGAARPLTLELVENLNRKIDRYVRIQLSARPEALIQAKKDHEALYDCLSRGDADQGRSTMAAHIRFAAEDLLGTMTADNAG